MVKVEINFSNKFVYLVVSVLSVLVIAGIGIAYGSGASPSVFGHSAEELEVNISGDIYTLQEAITNNLIGGGGLGSQNTLVRWYQVEFQNGVSPWITPTIPNSNRITSVNVLFYGTYSSGISDDYGVNSFAYVNTNVEISDDGTQFRLLSKKSDGITTYDLTMNRNAYVNVNYGATGSSGTGSTSCSWIEVTDTTHLVSTFISNGGTGVCYTTDNKLGYIYDGDGGSNRDYISCGVTNYFGPSQTFSYYACK